MHTTQRQSKQTPGQEQQKKNLQWFAQLISIINEVIEDGIKATQPLPFKFENMSEAAAHNAELLAANDFNVAKVLEKYKYTVFHPGTEFCPVESLQKLLG